jgi:hypothetical protein
MYTFKQYSKAIKAAHSIIAKRKKEVGWQRGFSDCWGLVCEYEKQLRNTSFLYNKDFKNYAKYQSFMRLVKDLDSFLEEIQAEKVKPKDILFGDVCISFKESSFYLLSNRGFVTSYANKNIENDFVKQPITIDLAVRFK